MKKISTAEITLTGLAVAIAVLLAASTWVQHGTPVPFLQELGRGAVIGIMLWVSLNHANQRRHSQNRREILVCINNVKDVDDKVETVLDVDHKVATVISDLVDRVDGVDKTGPMSVIRRLN